MKSLGNHKGLVQVYYGDGKGKTTAAIGQGIRSVGAGMRVVMIQFLKNTPTGELKILEHLPNFTLLRGKSGAAFMFQMTEEEKKETIDIHNENMEKAWEIIARGECDLLILDEGIDAYHSEILDRTFMEKMITQRPEQMEVVVTGHRLPEFFEEHADYITQMKKIRHPYDKQIAAREGIEF